MKVYYEGLVMSFRALLYSASCDARPASVEKSTSFIQCASGASGARKARSIKGFYALACKVYKLDYARRPTRCIKGVLLWNDHMILIDLVR